MKGKHLLIPLIAVFLAIGMQQTYAEEVELPRDETPDDKSCYGTVTNTWIQFTCNWKWMFEQELDLEGPTQTNTTIDSSIDEIIEQINEIIEQNTLVIEEPEPTEAEKLGITEEQFQRLEEKRQEQGSEAEILKECLGGQGQAFAFQGKYAIVDLLDKYTKIPDYEQLSLKEKKLIQHCLAILKLRDFATAAYPGLVVYEDTSYKTEPGNKEALEKMVGHELEQISQADRENRYADASKLQAEAQRAFESAKAYNDPYKDFPGVNRGGFVIPDTDFRQDNQPSTLKHEEGKAKRALCDLYYPLYEHAAGTDQFFPKWLEHCIGE